MFKIFDKPQKSADEKDEATLGIGTAGTLTVKLYDRNGHLKSVRGPMRNLIVWKGKSYICNQLGSAKLSGKSKKGCRWIGIGHGSTAAATANTKLQSQRARRLNTFTFTSGKGYFSCITTFTSFGAGTTKSTIYESGLFWGSSTQDNVMLARQTFAAVTKLTADTLTVEWRVSVT